ncbi:hypothetical protein IHE45_15G115500 [Dioscorea alata]|uniref:Uncharacterized protein n=1 Tax=Dioscorea alata TaxID=55571 RepID=A0ACB7UNZ2_DIOAL|nr:hypothetical protein IHE45_15G115500 [Dioscorea alata]
MYVAAGNSTSTAQALLKWLDEDVGKLARIEVLVVISGALMTFLALFGSYRRRSRSALIKYTLWAAFTLTDSISAYTIGLMQTANFHNNLFLLWSLFLIIIKCSTNSITAFSVQDNDNKMSYYFNLLLLILYVGFIFNSYFKNISFGIPLYIFVFVFMFKAIERLIGLNLVDIPNRPMLNTKLVSDYMHYEHELSNEVDPVSMKGYKYLVTGEDPKDTDINPPDYLRKLRLNDSAVKFKVITVEKIWRCPGRVLKNSKEAKDVCLSFAFFKLLRRHFTGYPWAEAKQDKTKRLILEGLLNDPIRAFKVIETELGFLYDSFYTKYAVITGKPLLLLSSVATLLGSFWTIGTLFNYKPSNGELHMKGNIDVLITVFFLLAISFVEFWQIITYVFSDWAKVLLLCYYVKLSPLHEMNLLQTLLSFVCRKRVLKPWDQKLGQYSLLDSYGYEPCYLKTVLMRSGRGQKESPFVQLPEEVKKAIAQSLIENEGKLKSIGESLLTLSGFDRGAQLRQLLWACKLETYTEIILVWHVATFICLKKTALDHRRDEDQFNHNVADSLSKYCAYLVVFAREFLLPEPTELTSFTFDRTVFETSDLLKGKTSMSDKLNEIMKVGDDPPQSIVKKGGKLGRQLIELVGDESLRFRVLKEIWVKIILCIAPSDNTNAHLQHLTEGGEFITHVWTLLCHLGIFQRPQSGIPDHPV